MSINKVLSFGIFVIAAQVFSTTADDINCKGVTIKINEEQIKFLKECAAASGVKVIETMTPEQVACMSKCLLERQELVDDQGKPHKENILKHIDAAVPHLVKDALKAGMGRCLDTHGSKIDSADSTCMTYLPMIKCVQAAFMEVCV